MALDYQIKINGTTLDATIGVSVHDKLEEALDESGVHLPITVLDYPQKMLGLLEITIDDGSNDEVFNYLVISDEVQVQSKDGFYNHSLTAIEYTHKLDKFFISALTFTNPFAKRSRAPFQTYNTGQQYEVLPTVQFQENYFTDEVVTLSQVRTGYFKDGAVSIIDVYVRTNVNGTSNTDFTTPKNLSSNDVTYTMPTTAGDFYFDVGYYDGLTYVVKFRHYIRVIKEQRYTLKDMVERVRAAINIERESFFDDTRLFDLDSNLDALFESIEMPQMFFRQQSARQVLNTMFKYINAISRLQYIDGSNDKLTIDLFNKITGSFNNDDIVDLSILQDAQNYGTKALSFLQNALQSNFRDNPSIKTAGTDKFKTVRSSAVQLTKDTFQLQLEKPIYEISKIEVMIPEVDFVDLGLIYSNTETDFVLDLTPRFLEKTFWDLKTRTVDILTYNTLEAFTSNVGMRLNQSANFYWTKNTNTIDLGYQIGTTFKTTVIEEVIQEALNEEITLRVLDSDILGDAIDFDPSNLPLNIENAGFYQVGGLSADDFYRNIKFNIEYITLENTVTQIDRQDVSDNDYESYMRINEGLAVTNYARASRDLFGKLERSALPKKTITKVHLDVGSLLQVGQIDEDGYIITERQLVFHNEFIEAIYTATKNHNRLNEFNGINQEYRVFEIPSFGNSVHRKDFYGDYIFITKPDDTNTIDVIGNKTILNSSYYSTPFNHITNNTSTFYKVTFAFVKTDGFSEQHPSASGDFKAIMTPIISFGGKGGLNFTFDFDSNLIAGSALVKSDDNNIYNRPIWYTNSQGFFDNLWFGLGFNYNSSNETTLPQIGDTFETYFNEEYSYPLMRSTLSTMGQAFMFQNGSANNPDWFKIYKDASTSYGFAYHLAIVPYNHEDYVIGQSFYETNPLVYDFQEIDKYIYIYTNGTTYNKFDDLKIKSGHVGSIKIIDNDIVFNATTGVFSFEQNLLDGLDLISNKTGWAIGDAEGNLYLASNSYVEGFKIFTRHLHPNLLQIGNK